MFGWVIPRNKPLVGLRRWYDNIHVHIRKIRCENISSMEVARNLSSGGLSY